MKTKITTFKTLEGFFINELLFKLKEYQDEAREDQELDKFTANISVVGSDIINKIIDNGELICESVEFSIRHAYKKTFALFNTDKIKLNLEDVIFWKTINYFMENMFSNICLANQLFNINYVYSVGNQFPYDILDAYNWSEIDGYKDEIIDLVYQMSVKYGFTDITPEEFEKVKPYINWYKFKANLQDNILDEEGGEELLKR